LFWGSGLKIRPDAFLHSNYEHRIECDLQKKNISVKNKDNKNEENHLKEQNKIFLPVEATWIHLVTWIIFGHSVSAAMNKI
jgi:hypothetical protein